MLERALIGLLICTQAITGYVLVEQSQIIEAIDYVAGDTNADVVYATGRMDLMDERFDLIEEELGLLVGHQHNVNEGTADRELDGLRSAVTEVTLGVMQLRDDLKSVKRDVLGNTLRSTSAEARLDNIDCDEGRIDVTGQVEDFGVCKKKSVL